jgi:ADP-ribose pyrophosphatase YjhB (NUDIX family)
MVEYDFDIVSVSRVPEHCQRCGAELGRRSFEGNDLPWCADCAVMYARNPVPGVHLVVLDEPIPQHEGLLSLPGGHARPDEHPTEAVVRELEEETGLTADPDDLRFLTVVHAEFPETALYLLTYAVERERVTGELTPEFEDGAAFFEPLEELRGNPGRIRDSDLQRIGLAFED